MPKKPLVSIYLPTRNRSRLLPNAIGSVLQQTWDNLELIVVDDASDDSTPEILQQYSEKSRIKVIRNQDPAGAAASRNLAVGIASGEFVTGIDDDDLFMPERIEMLVRAFTDGISGTCSNDRMVYDQRELIWKKRSLISSSDLLFYNQVGNQLLTRRDYFSGSGGFDESLPSAQDYDLWIRIAQNYGPVKTVPHTLQVVNMKQDETRITLSEDKITGYRACFEKHKQKMSPEQIQYQRYRLALAEGRNPSWNELISSVPASLWFKEIKRKLFF
ncbi:MAG: glycosyltransferase [Balneolaceae bacterium]|nr:MAG: glycosyltransferase [Balneolaceae bacterium]